MPFLWVSLNDDNWATLLIDSQFGCTVVLKKQQQKKIVLLVLCYFKHH